MKTFLRILFIVLLVIVSLRLLPFLAVPIVFGAAATVLVGTTLTGGLAALTIGLLALIFALLVGVVALAVALSPIWIPVMAIVGIVSLCRRRPAVPPATTV